MELDEVTYLSKVVCYAMILFLSYSLNSSNITSIYSGSFFGLHSQNHICFRDTQLPRICIYTLLCFRSQKFAISSLSNFHSPDKFRWTYFAVVCDGIPYVLHWCIVYLPDIRDNYQKTFFGLWHGSISRKLLRTHTTGHR